MLPQITLIGQLIMLCLSEFVPNLLRSSYISVPLGGNFEYLYLTLLCVSSSQ